VKASHCSEASDIIAAGRNHKKHAEKYERDDVKFWLKLEATCKTVGSVK
jgi:hypothetical protein